MAPPQPTKIRHWFKMGGLSFLLHLILVIFFSLNPFPTIMKAPPSAYTVTLVPISIPEPEVQKHIPIPTVKEEKPKPIEKTKIEKPKKDDIVEKIKKIKKEKAELKHLQEAIEEIRKKVALDEIQKRVARREKVEEPPAVPPSLKPILPSPTPVGSTSEKAPSPELPKLESLYGSLVELKIKEAWTIPENLLKEMVDLETIIVVIIDRDGKVQHWWFEKKSGNILYDQSTLRAIKKAEPLPPIPKELGKDRVECQIRFTP